MVDIETMLSSDDLTSAFIHDRVCRQASHCQLKALFSQIEEITGKTMQQFRLPAGISLRPTALGETRAVTEAGDVYLVNSASGLRQKVWPREAFEFDFHILCQVTDRGPIVTGALHFALSLQYLTSCFWGFFHSQWNALKNAAKAAMKGKCWKAIIRLMIVWNMNAGPYRSGQWYRSKQEALKHFCGTRGADDPDIKAILPQLAHRSGLPCRDEVDELQVYNTCFCGMRSFHEDGPVLKLMRWCGLREVRDFYHAEMPGLRLVLSHMSAEKGGSLEAAAATIVGEGTTTAAHAEVEQKMKEKKGTINLAPTYITDENEDAVDLFLHVTKAEQELYAHRASQVKTAEQSLTWHLAFVKGAWRDTWVDSCKSLFDTEALELLHCADQGPRAARQVEDIFEMLLTVIKKRAETCIPEAFTHPYTSILNLDLDVGAASHAKDVMLEEWEILVKAERLSHRHDGLRALLAEIPWASWAVVRLYMHLNEQACKQGVESQSLTEILRCLHVRLGDEKGAEDIHQYCRDEGRRRRFANLTSGRLLRSCIDSLVPKKRQMPSLHVDFGVCMQNRKSLKRQSLRQTFIGKPRYWPDAMQDILKPRKTWPTPTVKGYYDGASAWLWLLHFFRGEAPAGSALRSAWYSKLPVERWLLRDNDGYKTEAALTAVVVRAGPWHVLVWEVEPIGDGMWKMVPSPDSIKIIHITGVGLWQQAPATAVYLPTIGIVLEAGAWSPLLVTALLHGVKLNKQELLFLGSELLEDGAMKKHTNDAARLNAILDWVFFNDDEARGKASKACAVVSARANDELDDNDLDLAEALEEICIHDADNLAEVKEIKESLRQSQLRKLGEAQKTARREKQLALELRKAQKAAAVAKKAMARAKLRARVRPRKSGKPPAAAKASPAPPAGVAASSSAPSSSSTSPPPPAAAAAPRLPIHQGAQHPRIVEASEASRLCAVN